MNAPTYSNIIANGFWNNNPGLVQLLGLCPLLAVSGTLINGLGMGIATTFVVLFSNLAVSSIRRPIGVMIRSMTRSTCSSFRNVASNGWGSRSPMRWTPRTARGSAHAPGRRSR